MPKVPYSYEVNGKLVTGNGSLIPICSLLPSLTVIKFNELFIVASSTTIYLGNCQEIVAFNGQQSR